MTRAGLRCRYDSGAGRKRRSASSRWPPSTLVLRSRVRGRAGGREATLWRSRDAAQAAVQSARPVPLSQAEPLAPLAARPVALTRATVLCLAFQDPLAIGGWRSSWRDPRRARALRPVLRTRAEARRWESWIARVDQGRVKNVTVAIRRTLFAAADRADPIDARVDAVIAWENLVRSTQGEPLSRIFGRASVAHRQERGRSPADPSKSRPAWTAQPGCPRDRAQPAEANERQLEALDIAQALRQMFHRHLYLLTGCKSSTERSMRLIIPKERTSTGKTGSHSRDETPH